MPFGKTVADPAHYLLYPLSLITAYYIIGRGVGLSKTLSTGNSKFTC